MATRLRKSSGNVFRDLGFPEIDAENLRIRSELMVKLRQVIDRSGLTQRPPPRACWASTSRG
jgi:predicted XRE-type DNA-binding protein